MPAKPRPKPCFLDDQENHGVRAGRKVWRSADGERHYTWDSLHGEIEVFDALGYHLGAADAVTGDMIKEAVAGRRLEL
jgi:Cytotoxic